jgi:hypothetical protein
LGRGTRSEERGGKSEERVVKSEERVVKSEERVVKVRGFGGGGGAFLLRTDHAEDDERGVGGDGAREALVEDDARGLCAKFHAYSG